MLIRDERRQKHTSNSNSGSGLFPSCQENDVLLRGVDIVIFYNEDFIDSMFLKGRKFDQNADWASQCFLDHKVLLASNLRELSIYFGRDGFSFAYIHFLSDPGDPCVLCP